LPEVGGSFVQFLDPWDLNAWVDALRKYINDPGLVSAYNQHIEKNYRPPRWDDFSRDTYSYACRLAASKPVAALPTDC
jgi:hypothetical protein